MKAASEEAWQAPKFDEYVICSKGMLIHMCAHIEHVAHREVLPQLAQPCTLDRPSMCCVDRTGKIDFIYGDGQKASIVAGQGIFLPKELRVKWVWLEASSYFVLCLPAFSPVLCGREAEEGATVAKDSASMQRLEELHQGVHQVSAQ